MRIVFLLCGTALGQHIKSTVCVYAILQTYISHFHNTPHASPPPSHSLCTLKPVNHIPHLLDDGEYICQCVNYQEL